MATYSTNDNSKDNKKRIQSSDSVFSFYSSMFLKEMVETKQPSLSNKNNNIKMREFLNEMDKAMEKIVLNEEILNTNDRKKENRTSYEIDFNGTFKPVDEKKDDKQREHHHKNHHHHHHLNKNKEEKNE